MSDTRTLKDKFKAAQEVTSLASADRLMVVGSDGSIGKISSVNLEGNVISKGFNSGQWVRLFSIPNTSVLFILEQNFFNNPGGSVLVHACIQKDGLSFCSVNTLSKLLHNSSSDSFTKVRVVRSSTISYVDFLYSRTQYNDLTLKIVSPNNGVQLMMEGNATIPDGFTAKEYNLTAPIFGGGVKHYRSINYAILQKGGLRDGEFERALSGNHREVPALRYATGVQQGYELRYRDSFWSLSGFNQRCNSGKHSWFSERGFRIRSADCMRNAHFCRPAVHLSSSRPKQKVLLLSSRVLLKRDKSLFLEHMAGCRLRGFDIAGKEVAA